MSCQGLPELTMGRMSAALDVLKAELTPRQQVLLTVQDRETRKSVPTGAPSYYIALLFVMERAARMGVAAHRLRAACHLIWGRPCYAGRGSLTLCGPSGVVGALTMKET